MRASRWTETAAGHFFRAAARGLAAALLLSLSGALYALPSATLTANPASVAYGASSSLTWSSSGATVCAIPWGSSAVSGSYVTPPLMSATTFTITCYGPSGSQSASVTVAVGALPPPPVVTLAASAVTVAYNATSTLTWASAYANNCNTPWGDTAIGGAYTTPPITYDRSFTVTCSGYGGSNAATVSVRIGAATTPPSAPAPTVTLTANPAAVAQNGVSVLTWGSTNATACTTPWGATAVAGSYTTPALTATTPYSISCSGPGGTQSASVTVTVSAPAGTSGLNVTLVASPASVAYGGTSTLAWSSTNASVCALPWGGSATSGSYATPPLFGNGSYTITCYGPAGSQSASANVVVAAVPPAPTVSLSANPATVAANGVSVLSWGSTNATSCNTPWGSSATGGSYSTPPITYDRTFTVTCSGYGGSGNASASVHIGAASPPPAPTLSFNASANSVPYNGSAVLTWSAGNATACTTPWGATATAGSYTTPALTSTTSYAMACTGSGGSTSASLTIAVAPQGDGTNPPIVLNASTSAQPGDTVSLQGENFGDSPRVYLDGNPGTPLAIENRVGSNWLAVTLPATATGALVLRVQNATGTSAPVRLNAAKPLHLDAIQLVPGGAFRVFGRNLYLSGSMPSVSVGGAAAAVDLGRSNEHMLSVTAPATLVPTTSAVILVDNGNGSGPAQLDRSIEVVASGGGDPFGLGVGWAAGFADLATRTIDAATDARLSRKVVCNGSVDDSPALQQAIQLAVNIGGGVVRLPAGRCRMAGGLNLSSKVVVQGAGKTTTELAYESNYPVYGVGLDLVGLRNLALTNAGAATEGPLLKQSTRVFLQNVRVQIGTSSQMFLDGNRNAVIAGSDFVQTGSVSHQGPYTLSNSAGLVFENNTTQWMDGAPTFGRVHDSYLHDNRFTRDGSAQNLNGVVHAFTVDFAYRIAVINNTFDVANGPITNAGRNDGETILTEGGGTARTENLGSVASAGANTLSDPSNTLNVDPFGEGYIPENYGIAIVAGKGAGQTRRVVAYAGSTVTVERAWDIVPDGTSRYASFVWGLEKSLVKNNTLSQNPRGIWLYQTAVREVDLIGNTISEGGGIYLRSYQNLAAKSFIPIYNVLIAQNKVSNGTGHWMSYINAVFVNTDARAYGIANLGIEMRANQLTANIPNVVLQTEEYASNEGLMNMMRVENYSGYESSVVPRMLGTILTRNSCTNCDTAVRIGTGAGGTTILNTQLFNCPLLLQDLATTVTPEKSTNTVAR